MMMYRKVFAILLTLIAVAATGCGRRTVSCTACDEVSEAIPAAGFVALADGQFAIDGEHWFPKMLNYKADLCEVYGRVEVVPAPWYTGGGLREHFDTIASWGFNAVRICLDGDYSGLDTAQCFEATRRAVMAADSAGLRVMLLMRAPLDKYWRDYDCGLMRRLADLPALWAYDLMNEPLYFDPEPERDKCDAANLVCEWRKMVRRNAPHQLFTVATAEPIEVFEWDPSMLPVDFIEMHTYHPLRVQAEMWWYSHYCGKPWMVGETGLPADNDSVTYGAQAAFMFWTYRYAKINNAIGYGWWEFQDCPNGVNFEAKYTGLRDIAGNAKPAADIFKHWFCLGVGIDEDDMVPINYYNMLAYMNVAVTGKIVDAEGRPIEGAVIRGWNEDWSVGMNTYSDSAGRFRLVSNDVCTHFEVSAPGCSKVKLNKSLVYPAGMQLPDRQREYQQIPVMGWGEEYGILPFRDSSLYNADGAIEADMGMIELRKLL